jgi:SAM-dependent methyltransferase
MMSDRSLTRYYPSDCYYSYQDGTKINFLAKVRTFLIQELGKESLMGKILTCFIHIPGLPEMRKRGTILDVGCGSGDTLFLLSQNGWITWGIDQNSKTVLFAKRRNLYKIIRGSFPHIRSLPKFYFDTVRMYCVLEHLNKPKEALKLSNKILKNDGELILSMQNTRSIAAFVFGTYWYHLDLPRHRFHFSPYTIKKMLEDTGFTNVYITYHSLGGILGSISHYMYGKFNIKVSLEKNIMFVFLLYPIEWFFDRLFLGDMMVVRARKR